MKKTVISLLGLILVITSSVPAYGMWARFGSRLKTLKSPAIKAAQVAGSGVLGLYSGHSYEDTGSLIDESKLGMVAHLGCAGLAGHTIRTIATPSIAWTTKALAGTRLAACAGGYDLGRKQVKDYWHHWGYRDWIPTSRETSSANSLFRGLVSEIVGKSKK